MGILGKMFKKRKKYFRYDLFVNEGEGWKKFGEYTEYLDYEDIEEPTPGAVLKLYGVYKDASRKEGWARKGIWEHDVPMPGGTGAVAKGKKEKPIEERLMEKIVEGADFSGLKPSKMSLPFGKTGGTLDFEAQGIGGSSDGVKGGYIVMGDSKYPMGEIPPLEFEGKLPAWMHPAAGAMITGIIDRIGNTVQSSLGGAISQATGIKAKGAASKDTKRIVEKEDAEESPPDMMAELDDLLEEGNEKKETKRKEK